MFLCKSVTIKHILGFLAPDSGKVLINQKDTSMYSKREWRGVVAFPIREHRKMSNAQIIEKAMEKLEVVGLKMPFVKLLFVEPNLY